MKHQSIPLAGFVWLWSASQLMAQVPGTAERPPSANAAVPHVGDLKRRLADTAGSDKDAVAKD